DLLRTRKGHLLVSVGPDATAEEAIRVMESAGISQLPVVADGRSVGSIQEGTLARLLHDGRDPAAVPVREVMARPVPQRGVSGHLDEAYRLLLAGHTGVLAAENGRVADIVTRIDLVRYWDESNKERKAGRG